MMKKKNAAFLLMLFASVSVFADAPVVDYSSDASQAKSFGVEGTHDNFAVAPPAAAAPAVMPASNLSTSDRLSKVERQVNNLNEQNLEKKIEELQERLQKLNGQFEDQSHKLEQLEVELRNFYQDLNQRIEKGAPVAGVTVPAVVKVPSPAVPTVTAPVTTNASSPVQAGAVVAAPTDVAKKNATISVNPNNDSSFLKEQQMYQTAIDLLPDKKYSASENKLREYLGAYPHGIYAANAHYWLGEINFLQKNFDAAEEEFKTVIDKYAGSKRVADASFKIALVHQNQGRDAQAKLELKQVIKRYPGTSAAQLAKQQIGN